MEEITHDIRQSSPVWISPANAKCEYFVFMNATFSNGWGLGGSATIYQVVLLVPGQFTRMQLLEMKRKELLESANKGQAEGRKYKEADMVINSFYVEKNKVD